MPERVYMNRIPGQQRIHIEITAEEIDDVLADIYDEPAFAPGQRLRQLLVDARADFAKHRPEAPCPRWSLDETHDSHEWDAPIDGRVVCPGLPAPAAPAGGDR